MKKLFRKPAKKEALCKMQTVAGGGLTPLLYLERWGNMTNKLTPKKLAAILQAADDGDIYEQQALFSDMENRCEHLAAEMGKRKRALLTLDWEILPGRANDKKADEIAAKIAEQFDMLPTTSDLFLDMADAVGHGFAALEIEWGMIDGLHIPRAFHFRPQTWFQVLRESMNVLRLRDGSENGAELWPLGWVVHIHRSKSGWLPRVGLFNAIAWAYLIRSYALESEILYTQVHGLPFRVGTYPPGANKEDIAALRSALANLGRDASGIIPEGMQILFQTPANASQDIPGELVTRCEQGMSKAILGGTLTSQADGKTSTNALGMVHEAVRHDLLVSDAAQIADTITRQILTPLAWLNCGVADPALVPYFRFDTREAEDMESFARALPALSQVMSIPAWAHDKLKIPMPKDGEEVLTRQAAQSAPLTALKAEYEKPGDIQKVVDEAVPDESLALIGAELVQQLLDDLENCESLEAIMATLENIFPKLDTGKIEEMATKLMMMAAALGEDEANIPG